MGKISDLLVKELSYAYCDNCGTCDKDEYACDECNRKGQSWSLSESTALELEDKIKDMKE